VPKDVHGMPPFRSTDWFAGQIAEVSSASRHRQPRSFSNALQNLGAGGRGEVREFLWNIDRIELKRLTAVLRGSGDPGSSACVDGPPHDDGADVACALKAGL
jgi:hypothetical protein